jgi:glycosyltransferase involved in cell wall biosynthesis
MDSLVFVSDEAHLSAVIPGGVQLCTAEYIRLLESCGFGIVPFPIAHTRRFAVRLRIKLGLDVYERYDFAQRFPALCERIDAVGAKLVALNQVALLGFAPLLKGAYGDAVTVIILSHGNESGDFLHEVVRRPRRGSAIGAMRDICRLGQLIYTEAKAFAEDVDAVLAISEADLEINNWLGARRSIFVPRTFQPEDIGWSPDLNRIGFVGALHHKPNLDGLVAVLEELERREYGALRIRIVGGPSEAGNNLEARYPSVEYVGQLGDPQLRREAATWAAFLNPVFWYSRGASTKLAVGINWGLPVISTPAGNRGYRWTRGAITVVQTPRQMVDVILAISSGELNAQALAQDVRVVALSGPSITEIATHVRDALLPR